MKVKVSDVVAQFFADKGVRHVFGIVGSGNAHLFDSVYLADGLQMVCVHHEQAACMAMQTYYRTCGKVTAAFLTTGAGSTNGVTGVVSAWADSVPGIVISGNEHSKHVRADNPLRMYGVQGYDSTAMVSTVTKYTARVSDPTRVLYELEKAWHIATTGRPGPVWIDIPMDIQAAKLEASDLARFRPDELPAGPHEQLGDAELRAIVARVAEELRQAERPVLWLGQGIRLAGAEALVSQLMEAVPAACFVTWSAIDMVDSDHPRLYGRAGVYGQRAANFVLQNSDYVLTIGTRLAIPQVGYEISELARGARFTVVDVDPTELGKFPEREMRRVCVDAGRFVAALLDEVTPTPVAVRSDWIARCDDLRARYPWVGPEHADTNGFINSYRFMERLIGHLHADQIVTTDMGTALLSGHQVLKIKPGQRLMTSLGLGEMGFGLPAAMGASFARGGGEVLCLNCDGGMMMNLQELQTVAHHRLPIKIVVFNNDGYLMIKHTQKAIAGGRYAGSDEKSGVSCPDFSKLAGALGFPAWQVRTWADFDRLVPEMQAYDGPCILEVFMDPEQYFHPKLGVAVRADGSLVSPPLEDLSPLLPLATIEAEMLTPLLDKSRGLVRPS